MSRQLVLFTDLDGTLLDRDTYQWTAASTALAALESREVPWVLVTSKTSAEIETLRRGLGHTHPYVAENGQVTVIPEGYFPTGGVQAGATVERETIVDVLHKIKIETGFQFRSFATMGSEEIARVTGLSLANAQAANLRVSSEPVQWADSPENFVHFEKCIQQRGLICSVGGRFVQVTGPGDKGDAISRLLQAFQKHHYAGQAVSVALGDAPNDLPMLNQADVAVVVRSDLAPLVLNDKRKPVYRTQSYGPQGWNEAVMALLAGWPHKN